MNPPGPFDTLGASPPAAAPGPAAPTYVPDPSQMPQPSIPQPQIPMTAATAGEAGTITVTATAVMPQPTYHGDVLPSGNFAVSAGDPPKDAHGWALVRFYVWKFGGTLLMERSHDGEYVMSRSALPFFVCLALALFLWRSGLEVPAGLEKMMYALLGVMFGDRGLAIVQQLVTAKHGDPYAGRQQP